MKPTYPPGATHANWFSLFNAVSFQIALGVPMILYVKSLGASTTVLGIVAALGPLLIICQIPAAHYLERIGYKQFIFYGWGLRTLCIFAIAFIPITGFLGRSAKIGIIIFLLFIFNLLRGISSGAWLPWITALIPESVRGRFISRDQFFIQMGCLLSMLISAGLLSEKSHSWQFTLVFLLSAIGGWISLLFLKHIPDIAPGETLKNSNVKVPWFEIVTYPPFFRLTFFVLLLTISAGCAGVFGVAFLKSQLHFGDSQILLINTLFFLGALLTLPVVGPIIHRIGNKATLAVSMGIVCVGFLTWSMIAAQFLPPTLFLIDLLYFTGGIAGAGMAVAQVHLLMSTMPEMGRSHFYAFFSVITSLGAGFAPVAWGIMIDALNHFSWSHGPFNVTRFAIYYFIQFLILLVNFGLLAVLIDKKKQSNTSC